MFSSGPISSAPISSLPLTAAVYVRTNVLMFGASFQWLLVLGLVMLL